jgi:hypothetical protein
MLDQACYVCVKGGPTPTIFKKMPEPPLACDEERWGRIFDALVMAILKDPASELGGIGGQHNGSHNSASLEELTRSLEADGYRVIPIREVIEAHVSARQAEGAAGEAKRLPVHLRRLSGKDGGIWASHAKRPADVAVIKKLSTWLEKGGAFPHLSKDGDLVENIAKSLCYPPRIAPRDAIEAWSPLDERLFDLNRNMGKVDNVTISCDSEGVVDRFALLDVHMKRLGMSEAERFNAAFASYLEGSALHHVAALCHDIEHLVTLGRTLDDGGEPRWFADVVGGLSRLGDPELLGHALEALEAHPELVCPPALSALLETSAGAYADRVAALVPGEANRKEHEQAEWDEVLGTLRKHDPKRFAKPKKAKAPKKPVPPLPDLEGTMLKRYLRTASVPVWKDGDRGLSKAGGSASLSSEAWPLCPCCEKPMPLLLQLDLATVPAASGKGLLQVFYCVSTEPLCEVETEAYFGGKGSRPKSKLVRVVPGGVVTRPPKEIAKAIPARAITGWTSHADWPTWLEIHRTDDAAGTFCESLGERYYEATLGADKLGGWPSWVQDVEYPACPRCKKPMSDLLFQHASNGLSSTQWGDMGRAYVVRCKAHPTEVDMLSQSG